VKMVIAMSAAALLAMVGLGARASHPGNGSSHGATAGTSAQDTFDDFGVANSYSDDDLGGGSFTGSDPGQGSFLAPSVSPPSVATGTS
jgi:hypothetical protein